MHYENEQSKTNHDMNQLKQKFSAIVGQNRTKGKFLSEITIYRQFWGSV